MSERSGIHLNAGDSGWPVAAAAEAQPHKDGTGADPHPKATQVIDGVVRSSTETQIVTVSGSPTGGTFTLTYSGQTTAGIAFNASASAVQSALEALSNIAPGDVVVTGSAAAGYEVRFAGTLADEDVSQMTASGASLTGGTSPSVAVATRVEGEE